MTTPERWAFHTEIYAFRAVLLGIDEPISPCDPDGAWHDENLARVAKARLRDKIADENRRNDELRAADPEIKRNEQRYADGMAWQLTHGAEMRAVNRGRLSRRKEFAPSQDELRAARIALGMES